jgi:hypothetical protein
VERQYRPKDKRAISRRKQDIGHIQLVFPTIVSIEWRLLLAEMFVASLLYSRPLLVETTSQRSPFFSTPTLRHGCFSEAALESVQVTYTWEANSMKATGIPPHVIGFVNQRRLSEELKALPKILTKCFADQLDQRAIGGGDLSMTRLRDELLAPMLGPITAELARVVAHMSTQTGTTGDIRAGNQDVNSGILAPPFEWGGKYQSLPECYEISRSMAPPGE